MDFKLIWTDSAIDELSAIVRYISFQSGPEVARKSDVRYMKSPDPEAISRSWINPSREGLASLAKACVHSWKIAYKLDQDAKVAYVARVWHASRGEIEIK